MRYQLKSPYRDGTTHVVLEPLDFIARLAALVPKPRVNLTPYHGVFAPNSAQRREVTPAQRGRRAGVQPTEEPKTDAARRVAMRLKRSASSGYSLRRAKLGVSFGVRVSPSGKG